MSSASDVVCATKRWEMDLRELMYVSVSTSCTVATATAMTKLVWNLVKCEHFHTNLNFDELCKVTCSLIPWPNRHKAGTLCKGRKQTMEAIFPIIFLVRGIICRHSLVAWLHKMGLWQFQFSELCCVQMCFQKVWTSNWMFLGSIVWCVRTPVIMCTHVVCLWQWSAKWLAWFSFYVSLCIQASHYFLNTSLVWYSPYTMYWLPQIYEKKLYFSNGCFNPFWIQYRLRLWLL